MKGDCFHTRMVIVPCCLERAHEGDCEFFVSEADENDPWRRLAPIAAELGALGYRIAIKPLGTPVTSAGMAEWSEQLAATRRETEDRRLAESFTAGLNAAVRRAIAHLRAESNGLEADGHENEAIGMELAIQALLRWKP